MFVAKLVAEGLKHRSIKTYMAGVWHLHIEEGLFMPVLARLHHVLRGVKRAQGEAGAGRREWGMPPHHPSHSEEDQGSVGQGS